MINPNTNDDIEAGIVSIANESLKAAKGFQNIGIGIDDEFMFEDALGQAKISIYNFLEKADTSQTEAVSPYHANPNIKEDKINLLAHFAIHGKKVPIQKIAKITGNNDLREML